MTRTVGVMVATMLVGLGMNGPEYNGTFRHGLSFSHICAILAVPAACMAPISWLLIHEPRRSSSKVTRGQARRVRLRGGACEGCESCEGCEGCEG